MRIVVYGPGEAPPVELVADVAESELTPREKNTLMKDGVWLGHTSAGRADWLKAAADGSIWAGGAPGKVAKVRGKDGRHLGGRRALPADTKKKTTSIQLAGKDRMKLERMAERATKAEGKRVTISGIVERLVRHAQA